MTEPPRPFFLPSFLNRRRADLFSFLLFAALFCFLFNGILFHGEQFGYRDSGYFYYPLFMQIQKEFDAGRFPLWDPCENLGEPLAANPAAAVFYPIRALFFAGLRLSISYHTCFKYYILFHLAAAFLTFLYLARLPLSDRKPLLSRSGSLFAALAWTFGGHILFQTTNVIFLTGAAWLPLLTAFECKFLLSGFRPINIGGTALTLFLIITGGDVQTAFLGILLFIPISFTFRKPDPQPVLRRISRVFVPFAVSLLLAFGLAAVQIFPAAELTRDSSRSRFAGTAAPAEQEESRSVYQFSVAPWRAAEFLSPGIGGREFPINTRWFSSLSCDRQLWTPSLYMGLYPFLAAISAFLLIPYQKKDRERERIRLFLSWLVFLTFIASWGRYGPGWFWRVMNGGNTAFQENDSVGGLYWLMTRVIPGWSAFRYPAKMITFTAFGLALLAGFGWDRFKNGAALRPFRFGLLILLTLSLTGLLFIRFGNPARLWILLTGTEFAGTRTIYGPCLAESAKRSALIALTQTSILTLLLFILTFFFKERFRRFLPPVLLLLLCTDLGIAQKQLVTPVPESVYTVKSPLTAELHSFQSNEFLPPRLYRDPFVYPADFLNTVSPNRLTERVRWDRAALFQKNAAEMGIANADVRGTFVPAGYYPISQYLRSSLNRWKKSGVREPGFDRLLAALGVDAYLVSLPGNGEERGISFKPAVNGGARARIIHNADRFTDWKDLVRYDLGAGTRPDETARITAWQPNRIELDAELQTSGSLILSEQFAPGWQGMFFDKRDDESGKPISVRCFATALRRVDLPAGEWHIIMEYRPLSFRAGLAVSGITWGGLLLVLALRLFLKHYAPAASGIGKSLRLFRG